MNQKTLFSLTAKDFEWSYTKGTGAGGQKRNKTSSAVHCIHKASGARGYSEASRDQRSNREDAFKKLTDSKEFKNWMRLEIMRQSGEMAKIDAEVERQMRKVKVEVVINGQWEEWNE